MKVVVTGGAGFIGANLCRVLASRPDVTQVIAFDDLSTGFAANVDELPGVELVVGSILDEVALRRVVAGSAAIAHLAARPSVPLSLADPMASHQVNVTGTVQVLEAAREVGAYVAVASSSAVYGENPATPKREDLAQAPMSPYGVTKVATEGYAAAYLHSFGVATLALRFFNVFGPLQPAGHAYAAVVPAFVSAALAGRPIPVHGDGLQVRDFVFVDTVAAVLARALTERITNPTPVNLASGSRTTLLGLIDELESILGRRLDVEHLPARLGDIRDSHADQTAFTTLFAGVVPVDLRSGLVRTVAWFESAGAPALPPG
ncbi:MAG: NAD-dependent epimerase/dehydratase family protein [Mycobacteriales bacterium]